MSPSLLAWLLRVSSAAVYATRPSAPRLHQLPLDGERGALSLEVRRAGEVLDIAVDDGPLTLNDTDLILAAALDGAGLGYLLECRVAGHLAAGQLVRVLDEWCPPFPGFFLYYPGRRQMPPVLRALIDFLQA